MITYLLVVLLFVIIRVLFIFDNPQTFSQTLKFIRYFLEFLTIIGARVLHDGLLLLALNSEHFPQIFNFASHL